jgi:hypothetical protein
MDKNFKASGIGSEEGVVMFDGEEKLHELPEKNVKAFEKFLNLKHGKGAIWIKTIADFYVTLTWIGKDFNCVVEVGQLTAIEIIPIVDRIEVFMFPNIGPPSTQHMEDIKSVISDSNTWKLDNRIAFYNVWENRIILPKKKIKIAGHHGTWHVVDERETEKHGTIYLLEHDTWGEECAGLIVTNERLVLCEDVQDGFDDYYNAYEVETTE